jgi:hypothetical protein
VKSLILLYWRNVSGHGLCTIATGKIFIFYLWLFCSLQFIMYWQEKNKNTTLATLNMRKLQNLLSTVFQTWKWLILKTFLLGLVSCHKHNTKMFFFVNIIFLQAEKNEAVIFCRPLGTLKPKGFLTIQSAYFLICYNIAWLFIEFASTACLLLMHNLKRLKLRKEKKITPLTDESRLVC